MNKERLLKVREAILRHPSRFNYAIYLGDFNDDGTRTVTFDELLTPGCGTVGCVAGFTLAVKGEKSFSGNEAIGAAKYLDLNDEQMAFLFYCSEGYGEPIRLFSKSDYNEAVKRIDILLAQE